MIALIFAALLAGYGIWAGDWTFVVAIILIACSYFITRKSTARLHRILLQDDGIDFDGTFTSWKDCEDFWLMQFPTYTELTIRKKKGLDRELLIQTADLDPQIIRETIKAFLPERSDGNERFIDMLIRLLKI